MVYSEEQLEFIWSTLKSSSSFSSLFSVGDRYKCEVSAVKKSCYFREDEEEEEEEEEVEVENKPITPSQISLLRIEMK